MTQLFLYAATAACFAASVQGPPWSWLTWLALAPMLYQARLLEGRRERGLIVIGHALIGAACAFYWVLFVGSLQHLGWGYRVPVFLTAACSIYASCIFTVSVGRGRGAAAAPWASAAAWVLAEYVWSLLYGGITHSMGYTQWYLAPLVQIASLTGIYGVSFVVAFFNTSLAEALVRRSWKPMAAPAVLIGLCLAYGGLRLSAYRPAEGPVVALLQGRYVPSEAEGVEARQARVRALYLPMAVEAGRGSDLIVWPETTVPVLAGSKDAPSFPLGREAAAATGKPQIFGASFPVAGRPGRLFNAGVYMDAAGEVRGVYRRVFPVPFGEYRPLPLRWMPKTMTGHELEPGTAPGLFDTPLGTAAVTMCGEAFLGSYTAAMVARGARVLLNLSNDVWLEGTPGLNLSYSVNVYRAVESGLPLVRVDNLGPSAVIDARGRTLTYLGPDRVGWLAARLPQAPYRPTPYAYLGDWVVGACAAWVFLLFLARRKNRGLPAAAAALLIVLCAPPARAEFRGYLKDLPDFTRTISDAQPVWQNLTRARLQWEGGSGALRALAAYDQELVTGSFLDSSDRRLFGLPRPLGWLGLGWVISEGRRQVWRHGFYRLYGEASGGPLTFRTGRQRVAWGTGKIWNPTDVLNPYPPLTLERDERPGVDAAYLRAELGPLSEAEAVYAPQDDWRASSALARLRLHPGAADVSLMGGKPAGAPGAWMAGGDVAADAGGSAVHAEAAYTRSGQGFWRWTAGWERTLSGPSWLKDAWVLLEYYRDGAGAGSRAGYDFSSLAAGRAVSLARDYFGAALRREVHPLVTAEAYAIWNLDDGSFFAGPRLTWEALRDLRLGAGWQLFRGGARDEFGRLRDIAYFQAQYYFQTGS